VRDNQPPDLDAQDGLIQFSTGTSWLHTVVETIAPVGYNLKPDAYPCDNSSGTCTVVALNDAKGPVGGVAELPGVASTPLEVGSSSGLGVGALAGIVAGAAAGAIALGGAAWYAWRRA